MKPTEFALLLTVARILRAHLKEAQPYPDQNCDLWALNEALEHFNGVPFSTISEALLRQDDYRS